MAFLETDEKQQFINRALNGISDSLKKATLAALDLILPPKCLKCSARVDQTHNICPDCWKDVQFISEPMCGCCGYPFGVAMGVDYNAIGINLCGVCQKLDRSFDKSVSVLRYDDHSRNMIIGFKHNDRLEYAKFFTKLLKQAGVELFDKVDMIIPVPLHKARLSQRRYNQSAILSKLLAADLGLVHAPEILLRIKNTPPQQGNLNKRSKNVRGAFKIEPNSKVLIKSKKILLIDDVYTTGSTAENCSKVLKKAGAQKVYVLTIFRVVSPQNIK